MEGSTPSPTSPVLRVPIDQIGETLGALRIVRPALEETMRRSLEVHGQMTPVTVWPRDGRYELVDGFKRLHAARRLPNLTDLAAQMLPEDAITAKRALLTLNQHRAGLSVLEEAWVIQSLIREERLSQARVAVLLGRDQSWVSRRLSLAERLIEAAREEVRLGLLPPTVARSLALMPRGIQERLLEIVHREGFTSRQVTSLAGMLRTASPTGVEEILADPREALSKGTGRSPPDPSRDRSLGPIAADLDRHARMLLNLACRLTMVLDRSDFVSLKRTERSILEQSLQLLWRQLTDLQRAIRSKLTPVSATRDTTETPPAPPSSPAAPTSRTSSSTCIA